MKRIYATHRSRSAPFSEVAVCSMSATHVTYQVTSMHTLTRDTFDDYFVSMAPRPFIPRGELEELAGKIEAFVESMKGEQGALIAAGAEKSLEFLEALLEEGAP